MREHWHPMTDEELVARIGHLKALQDRTAKQIEDCERTLSERETGK
jgi:hypothetical protein